MKATYDPAAKTKFTTSHRKEGKCFFSSMKVIDLSIPPHRDGTASTAIDCRLYGTGSQNSCCLWINHNGLHTSGSGKAGGYGYHRPSQAMENAIQNAGFTLSQDIGGVGESAMKEALLAMAETIGVKTPAIVEAFA